MAPKLQEEPQVVGCCHYLNKPVPETYHQTLESQPLQDSASTQSCRYVDKEGSLKAGCNFSHLKNIDGPIAARPILKRSQSLTNFACDKKASNRSLAVSNLNGELKKLTIAMPSLEGHVQHQPERRVVFHEIQMRLYDQTVGDHPCTSYGPPIALDWNYEEAAPVRVDAYEANRGKRRSMQHMVLNYYVRKNILMFTYGYSEDELKKATRATERLRFRRCVTNCFLPCSKIEEVVQSAGRKAKRVVSSKKTSPA